MYVHVSAVLDAGAMENSVDLQTVPFGMVTAGKLNFAGQLLTQPDADSIFAVVYVYPDKISSRHHIADDLARIDNAFAIIFPGLID